MEGMGEKRPRPRRSFMPQFKADIVERCRRGDRTVGQVAKDFDLTETAVRDWVRQAQADLDAIALRLNTRPRQTLDFDTPADRLEALLR
ncbi:transposase [Kitasatospora sp. NPDC057223]|uniref:transposase n=1 Tax=Kitasatospora sp. NPDC057223 TaxID=3346055 RepID=UPI003633504D